MKSKAPPVERRAGRGLEEEHPQEGARGRASSRPRRRSRRVPLSDQRGGTAGQMNALLPLEPSDFRQQDDRNAHQDEHGSADLVEEVAVLAETATPSRPKLAPISANMIEKPATKAAIGQMMFLLRAPSSSCGDAGDEAQVPRHEPQDARGAEREETRGEGHGIADDRDVGSRHRRNGSRIFLRFP